MFLNFVRLLSLSLLCACFCTGNLYEDLEGASNSSEVFCHHYQKLNSSSEKCDFIKTNDDCKERFGEGFLPYLQFPFCQFSGKLVYLGYALLFLWLIVLFIALGITADEYFCPSLRVISETLHLSQNVAGVTFLALGNGAPDIFSSIAAFSKKTGSGTSLAIEALLGAGIFVTTVVAGSIALLVPHGLTRRPFLRDIIFYLAAVGWAFSVLYRKEITLATAIGFLLLYVFYVSVVLLGRLIRKWHLKRKDSVNAVNERSKLLQSNINDNDFYWEAKRINGRQKEVVNNVTKDVEKVIGDEQVPSSHSIYGALAATEHTVVGGVGVNDPLLPPSNITDSDANIGTVPIIQAPRLPVNPLVYLLKGLFSLDVEEWKSLSIFWKIFGIIKIPIQLLLNATVPVVDLDKDEHERWNKWLVVFNCLLAPVFCVLMTKVAPKSVGSEFHVWVLALIFGVVLAVLITIVTTGKDPPKYQWIFAYIGFVVSVIWIYTIANEIVNLLETFGIIFHLSYAILGLTLLAWGNSIGDFVSNTAMARQGFPQMGVSACFGGPLLNLLLGFGISCVISTAKHGGTVKFETFSGHQFYLTTGFLALSLLSSFIVVPVMSFRMRRAHGVYLIILYIIFLVLSILMEAKKIKIMIP